MKIKDFINNAFGYTPKDIYQFTLPTDSENPESNTIQNSKQTPENKQNVFPNINENLEYVKVHFNFNMDDLIYLAKWMEYHTQKNYPSIRFLESIRGF